MDIQSMNVSKVDALKLFKEYREHRARYDKIDLEIERVCRQIARGNAVISVVDAIRTAGLDEAGRPKLAIGRADAGAITCSNSEALFTFKPSWRVSMARWSIPVRIATPHHWFSGRADIPRIPPQHRPDKKHLSKYWVLWEADWTEIPRDPYLLRRIGKDAWVVLAGWDLTDIEVSVLRAYRPTQ
jgi:hypothetical protein